VTAVIHIYDISCQLSQRQWMTVHVLEQSFTAAVPWCLSLSLSLFHTHTHSLTLTLSRLFTFTDRSTKKIIVHWFIASDSMVRTRLYFLTRSQVLIHNKRYNVILKLFLSNFWPATGTFSSLAGSVLRRCGALADPWLHALRLKNIMLYSAPSLFCGLWNKF